MPLVAYFYAGIVVNDFDGRTVGNFNGSFECRPISTAAELTMIMDSIIENSVAEARSKGQWREGLSLKLTAFNRV